MATSVVAFWTILFFTWLPIGQCSILSKANPPCGSGNGPCLREGYTDNAQLERFLFEMNDKYPDITRVFSIGKSVSGVPIWGIEISSQPGRPELPKPNLKYIGNLHGDEVVGRQILIKFIEYVLTQYTAGGEENKRIRHLVEFSNLFVLPTVNPDGFTLCKRENRNNIDLNRNFPDQFRLTGGPYQVETQNIMNWVGTGQQWDRNGKEIKKLFRYTLSANFHGGDVVVNYPFDGKGPHRESGVTDDDGLFKNLAYAYAKTNPPMLKNPDFTNGITNGVAWYPLWGGMQDWNYVWHGCMETTVEISCHKWPSYETIPEYWGENKDSLFNYWEQLFSGVRGRVTDRRGTGIESTIVVHSRNFTLYTQHSYFHRLLSEKGYYTITASAPGYLPSSIKFMFPGDLLEVNFILKKIDEPDDFVPEPKEVPVPMTKKPEPEETGEETLEPTGKGEIMPFEEDADLSLFFLLVGVSGLVIATYLWRRRRTVMNRG